MIGRTNTGGGITLHVIGGTTKPSGAGENTIWLNTDVTVPDWCIQNDDPKTEDSEPDVGFVWITTRTATDNVLNISHPHTVSLYLGTAMQWQTVTESGVSTNKWIDLDGEVYYGGAWHDIQTFVYNGDLHKGADNFNAVVGGKDWNNNRFTFTKESDYFQVVTNSGDNSIRTQYKIDFTNVSQVKIIYARTSTGNHWSLYLSIFESSISSPIISSVPSTTSASAKETHTIDTSSITGEYYFGYWDSNNTASGSVLKVYSIELIS